MIYMMERAIRTQLMVAFPLRNTRRHAILRIHCTQVKTKSHSHFCSPINLQQEQTEYGILSHVCRKPTYLFGINSAEAEHWIWESKVTTNKLQSKIPHVHLAHVTDSQRYPVGNCCVMVVESKQLSRTKIHSSHLLITMWESIEFKNWF